MGTPNRTDRDFVDVVWDAKEIAPDRWGCFLMERREAIVAGRAGRRTRRLGEIDFLLGVHDVARSGPAVSTSRF